MTQQEQIEELKKAANAIGFACSEPAVADDVARILRGAATEIERLTAELRAKAETQAMPATFGETYDGRLKTYPLVEMGYGLVSVAQSEIDGSDAVIFLKQPHYTPIGETIPSPEGKTHFDVEQMAAAITFANVAGLDVLISTLNGLRGKMTGEAPPAQAVSGNWEEAHKIIGRLMSSDPSFEDCTEATDFIRRMVADQSGPDGFATWKDAAIAERVKRVAAEKAQAVSVPCNYCGQQHDGLCNPWRNSEQSK